MTRLFGKNKDKTTIAELEEYYANQDQNKTNTAKAWLMAFISILITVVVVVALFYAGRWVYRAITDDSSETATTTQSDGAGVDLPTFDSDITGQGNQSGDSANNSAIESTPESGGVVSDQAASTSVSNAGNVSGISNTGGDEAIPNTGASDFIIVIPFVAAIAGYYISRRHYSKQN